MTTIYITGCQNFKLVPKKYTFLKQHRMQGSKKAEHFLTTIAPGFYPYHTY
jgi:hypothetical protein